MKALRYCTALYAFGDLFSCGHATPSHGIQPASSWDVQRRQTAHPLECRFWVKNGIVPACAACPFYPQEQTSSGRSGMSVSCQQRTHAPQQTASSFDNLVGAQRQRHRHFDAAVPPRSVMNSRRSMCPLRTRLVQCLKPSTFDEPRHDVSSFRVLP